MKRDMNLVRSILLALERYEHGYAPDRLEMEGFSEEQIEYHVYLMGQAGLLDTADVASVPMTALPVGITWQGHDFLELAREPSRWKRATEKVASTGSAMTIDILKIILASLAKQALGIP